MKYSYLVVFWSPFPITAPDFCMDFFSAFFRQRQEIQCLFCDSRQEERTLQLLPRADLTVVICRQNYQELCSWVTGELYRFTNCFYIIIDYIPEKDCSLPRISRDFRIPPSRLACIPYNPEYREAARRGNSLGYWGACKKRRVCTAGIYFYRELQRGARAILQALRE